MAPTLLNAHGTVARMRKRTATISRTMSGTRRSSRVFTAGKLVRAMLRSLGAALIWTRTGFQARRALEARALGGRLAQAAGGNGTAFHEAGLYGFFGDDRNWLGGGQVAALDEGGDQGGGVGGLVAASWSGSARLPNQSGPSFACMSALIWARSSSGRVR
jgi:hypothetical protein